MAIPTPYPANAPPRAAAAAAVQRRSGVGTKAAAAQAGRGAGARNAAPAARPPQHKQHAAGSGAEAAWAVYDAAAAAVHDDSVLGATPVAGGTRPKRPSGASAATPSVSKANRGTAGRLLGSASAGGAPPPSRAPHHLSGTGAAQSAGGALRGPGQQLGGGTGALAAHLPHDLIPTALDIVPQARASQQLQQRASAGGEAFDGLPSAPLPPGGGDARAGGGGAGGRQAGLPSWGGSCLGGDAGGGSGGGGAGALPAMGPAAGAPGGMAPQAAGPGAFPGFGQWQQQQQHPPQPQAPAQAWGGGAGLASTWPGAGAHPHALEAHAPVAWLPQPPASLLHGQGLGGAGGPWQPGYGAPSGGGGGPGSAAGAHWGASSAAGTSGGSGAAGVASSYSGGATGAFPGVGPGGPAWGTVPGWEQGGYYHAAPAPQGTAHR